MTLFVQNAATGGGSGLLDANQAAVDLAMIANGDTGLGLAAAVGNRQQVTYAQTLAGTPPNRLNNLVNTAFATNFGGGNQAVPIVIIPAGGNFTLNDGTLITQIAGVALPPSNSGLPGATLNTTTDCLVIYDTSNANGSGYCVARNGTGGTLDLGFPTSVILYHELSHSLRIATNTLNALTPGCNPSSPEENAAIVDENDMRTQLATASGDTAELRDPGIHCGNNGPCTSGCCIIASVTSGSPVSAEVQQLRAVRDRLLRATETGYNFFERFFRDYYAFSPQVCTLMVRRPELSQAIYRGFVRPLVKALGLIRAATLRSTGDSELGRLVREDLQRPAEVEELLSEMEDMLVLSSGGAKVEDEVARSVVTLLAERAWTSPHVTWALVDPLRLLAQALRSSLNGSTPPEVGRQLRTGIADWGAEVPLEPIWGALSSRELRRELRANDHYLLTSERARRRFRQRLLERFGDVTAIRTVLVEGGTTRGRQS